MGSAIHLGNYIVEGVPDPLLAFLHGVDYDGFVRSYFVTAVNAEGESDPSPLARTLMYQVPSRPRSPTAGWGDGEVTLSWEPPETDGGTPVVSYTIFRNITGEDLSVEMATLPTSSLRYVDDTVANGVTYTYWLTATNLAGGSEHSPAVSATPAGPPLPPAQLVTEGMNGSVRLTWQPPDWDGGRVVVGYQMFRISPEMEVQLLAELAADGLEFMDDGLVNGRVYLYAVRALSEAGGSVLSEMVEGLPVGPPTAPLGLLAYWMDDHVHITWSAPIDDGGSPVLGFRYHRDDRDAGNWTEISIVELVLRDYEVEHNATYNYTLYAYNEEGRGPAVLVTFTVPPEEAGTVDDDPIDVWPFIVAGAVLAAVVAAVALWRRTRRMELDTEDGGD